jgi:hypothetical protein
MLRISSVWRIRHIKLHKYVHSCKHDSHIYAILPDSEQYSNYLILCQMPVPLCMKLQAHHKTFIHLLHDILI